jgi:hypothetical protein
MTTNRRQVSIQILAVKEGASQGSRALAVARECLAEITDIGQAQGAEALLLCPAPEEFASEGIDLVVAARFGQELDEDTLFWRHADEIRHALKVEALVLDLDRPLGDFLNHIEPLLASPYRDELGRRDGIGAHLQV